MIETNLYSKCGTVIVATVLSPTFRPGQEAEVLSWNDRYFLRRADGKYYECFGTNTFTKKQLHWGIEQGLIV